MNLNEWRLNLRDGVTAGLSRIRNSADSLSSRFGRLQERMNRFSSGSGSMGGGLSRLSGLFRNVGGSIGSMLPNLGGLGSMFTSLPSLINPVSLAIVGVTAVIAAAVIPIKHAATLALNFENGMAKINATAQLTKPQLATLRNELIAVGKDGTAPLESIPEAYEKILSQTGNVNQSLDILKTSLKGAQAGFADVNLVAGAVAQTLSIVGGQNATAAQVMDTLLAAKKVGAGEFTDFAQYLPQLIAAGKNLGATYQETAGLFAFMTGKGQSAADSAMLIQNAFSALQKSEVMKGMQAQGIQLFNSDGSRRAIDQIMTDFTRKMSTMTDMQKTAFLNSIHVTDVQARNAFSVMSSDAAKLAETMDAVKNSTGETARQLESTATPSQAWDKAMNKVKGEFTELGYKLMPAITKAIDWVGSAFGWIAETIKNIIGGMVDWYNDSELLQDVAWLIGKIFEGIWWVISKIGDAISWIWDNVIKRVIDGISDAYSMIKAMLQGDFDKATNIAIHANADITGIDEVEKKLGKRVEFKDGKVVFVDMPKDEALPEDKKQESIFGDNPDAMGGPSAGGMSEAQKGISEINGGGKQQRIISVNFKNLVEQLQYTNTGVAQSAADIEAKFTELFLRVVQGTETALAASVN
jgi:TP901 family phage tail tape measure protein